MRRDFGERGLANWCQEEVMRLSSLIVTIALAPAAVAGQSTFIWNPPHRGYPLRGKFVARFRREGSGKLSSEDNR